MSDPAVTEMANKLAVKCLAVEKEVGDDRFFMKVGEIQGRDFLVKQIKAHRANKTE